MKKTTLLLLLTLAAAAQAQDSAAIVVNRYLKLLHYDALPQDSLLVLETTVTYRGTADTFTMHRYYQHEGMMRIEVRRDGRLTNGYCTNGGTRHRRFVPSLGRWEDLSEKSYHSQTQNYDFRGPLFAWRMMGLQLDYRGTALVDGHRLQVVRATRKDMLTRDYFFDPQSGLLTLILEKDERPADEWRKAVETSPIDFKFIHEYMPVGPCLIPSLESFQRDGLLTILSTTAHFEPRKDILFNQD